MLSHASWRRARAGHADTQYLQQTVRRKRLAACTAAALAIACSYYAAPSHAQNITGALRGTAPQGATIEVTSPAQGFSKTLAADSKGEYNLSQLNPGIYVVTVSKGGSAIGSASVQVKPNITAMVPELAAGAAPATSLGTITVSASSLLTVTMPIDVTTPELINNYSAALTHDLPINQASLYSVYALQSSAKSCRSTSPRPN